MNQLIVDPLVVSKVLGASEAEPYQLSALRDEDRSFFYDAREGFQDLHNYVDASIEMLEPKASSDAAAVALLSYMRQAPAFLALDWIETPKQRDANHDATKIYVNSGVLSTSNILLTEMASRCGVPSENLDYLKSPVLQNAAMKASANATASTKAPIFSVEALDKLLEWCRDSNPAKAALLEFDKSKQKDKDKPKGSRPLMPSLSDMAKTIQLLLKFVGASSDIALHAKNNFLSTPDGVRLSPFVFTRGNKVGVATEWFHAVRAASSDRFEKRDDHRDHRSSRIGNRNSNHNNNREHVEKKQ